MIITRHQKFNSNTNFTELHMKQICFVIGFKKVFKKFNRYFWKNPDLIECILATILL